ncbi:hypothetical protein KX832_001933 [Salmonella enterica]|nr:hypothetical protein [Salmonella enterica]
MNNTTSIEKHACKVAGMLIEGVMWQHIRKMMRLELAASRAAAAEVKTALAKARAMHKAVRYSQR